MKIRPAERSEVGFLAKLWYDGWRDAHASIAPPALTRLRTLESFDERMRAALANVRVAGPLGAPIGFHIIKGDEIYQFYVAAEARGSGLATILMADAEGRLRDAGSKVAWLACAIGNDRAARFYEKVGWRRVGNVVCELETSEGPFPLEVWRYEKALAV